MSDQERPELTDAGVLIDFLPKLIRMAERHMSPGLRNRVSSEDMAHSAIGSILRMEKNRVLRVSSSNSEEFWPFIVTILLNKIRKRARFERAKKRDYARDVPLDDDRRSLAEMIAEIEPETEYAGACFADLLERLRAELGPDSLIVLDGKLEGLQRLQIAELLDNGKGKSTKSVTRLWKDIERRAREIAEEFQE